MSLGPLALASCYHICMSDTKVWAYYRLRKSILLSPECLGQSLPVKVLGVSGTLHMPSVEWNKDNEPYLTPPSFDKDALAQLKQHNERRLLWGGINSWNPEEKTFDAFGLSSMLFELDLDTEQITYSDYIYGRGHPIGPQIKMLGGEIDEWFDELCAWIAAKTKQDLDYRHPLSNVSMPGQRLQTWTVEGEIVSLIATPNVIQVSVDRDAAKRALKKDDLAKIITSISDGVRPPENHLFLRDARDASKRGQMRKAAIDAGTAVEVTLRNYAISNSIPIRTQPPAMLGWYVHNTAPGLPADAQAKLVDVRNDATHYNAAFNGALVPDAINIATQIVESLDPLVL